MTGTLGRGEVWPHTRKHFRVPYGARVTFKSRHQNHKIALARDLSEGGTFIASSTDMSIGTALVLFLRLPLNRKTSSLCIVSGKIVRKSTLKETQGYGVQFDKELSKSTLKMLKEYIAQRQTQPSGQA